MICRFSSDQSREISQNLVGHFEWRHLADESKSLKATKLGRKYHDEVIKWKHFPRYWPFVWGIHRSPVNSLHKGQWRGSLMFSLICVWINGWVNNHKAGDLRRYRAHYDVTVMLCDIVVINTVSVGGLPPLPAWTSAGTVMIRFEAPMSRQLNG